MSEKKSHSEPEKSTHDSVIGVHRAGHSRAATSEHTKLHAGDTPLSTSTSHDRSHAHVVSYNSRPGAAQGLPIHRLHAPWSRRVYRVSKLLAWPRLIGVIVVVLVFGGATYVAVAYLSNTPEYIYARGIKNSGTLIDSLATYAQQLQSAPYKSTVFDGSMQGSDVLGHYNINLSGTENRNGDGLFSALGDVDGMPLSSSIRTVAVTGSALPDAYVNSKDLNALKPLIGVQGLPTFDQFDNKWILIDHNLLESYLDNLIRIGDKNIDKNAPMPGPGLAQISDALTKIQAVSKQYLLTTNSNTAVFKDPTFIGSETDNGRQLNRYRVTYNTAHLGAYLQALGQALDSSKLNTWSQNVDQGKNLDQTLNLAAVGHSVQEHTSTGNTADIWIDRDSKIITKVQINNPSATLSSVVITQGYTGGSKYPFTVTYNGKDKNGTTYTATVNVILNTDTHKATISFDDQSQAHGLHDDLNASVSLIPSNTTVQVSTPSGAVPFLTALEPSGLSKLAKP